MSPRAGMTRIGRVLDGGSSDSGRRPPRSRSMSACRERPVASRACARHARFSSSRPSARRISGRFALLRRSSASTCLSFDAARPTSTSKSRDSSRSLAFGNVDRTDFAFGAPKPAGSEVATIDQATDGLKTDEHLQSPCRNSVGHPRRMTRKLPHHGNTAKLGLADSSGARGHLHTARSGRRNPPV